MDFEKYQCSVCEKTQTPAGSNPPDPKKPEDDNVNKRLELARIPSTINAQ
jgi:hypothetical protein